MTINLSVPATHELKPRITVFGVGGAGGNAVNNMITSHLEGVEFVVANTDAQALSQGLTERRIQLGTALTQGLGAGARPDIGRQAAEEALDNIEDHLQGSNMAFITAGMGGGTGTGAAPIIAQRAREHGILTVGVVTKPFLFEGKHRMRIAEAGIDELQAHVDTLIVIPNQNLFRIATENTTFSDAFKMADDVLYSGVRGVTDLMVMPGLINLDYADVRSVMMEMGKAMMGTGEAEGDKRSLDAAEAAINNPLLDDVSLKGAHGVLVNITGGPDMTLFEVDEACNHIRDQVDPEANIIFGSTFDDQLAGHIRVSVVATGIDDGQGNAGALAGAERLATPMASAPPAPAMQPSPVVETPVAEAPIARSMPEPEPVLEVQPLSEPEPEPERPILTGRPTADRIAPAPQQPAPAVAASEAPIAESSPEAPRPRLFDWMKRSGRPTEATVAPAAATPALQAQPAAAREPVLEGAGAAPAAPPIPASMAPHAPAQPTASSTTEEDLLDIPAFLRRQST